MHREVIAFAFVALAACGYDDVDPEDALFKCDPENPCPADYFCSAAPAGVCLLESQTGCMGQRLSRYWGFNEPETASTWTRSRDEGNPMEFWAAFDVDVSTTIKFVGGGSLRVSVVSTGSPDTGIRRRGWLFPASPAGDLTHKMFSARVRTETVGVSLKGLVELAPTNGWNGGPSYALTPDEWRCAALDLDAPEGVSNGYDPALAAKVGFELWGPLPMVVYIDDAGY